MSKWLKSILVCITVVFAASAFADSTPGEMLLRYKFVPEQAMQYDVTVTGSGNVQISGNAPKQVPKSISILLDVTGLLSQTCKSVDEDGTATIEFKYDEMNATVNVVNVATSALHMTEDGTTMTVNGKDQQVPSIVQELMGRTLTLKVDDRGRVLAIEGLEKILEALRAAKLDNFNLEQLSQQNQLCLPEKPVSIGDSWENTLTITAPGTDGKTSLQIPMRYTFAGIVEEEGHTCARIDFVGDLNLPKLGPLSVPQQLRQGPVTSMTVQLKDITQQARGTYYFNITEGRMERADVNQTISMQVITSGQAQGPKGKTVPFTVAVTLDNMTTTSAVKLVAVSD